MAGRSELSSNWRVRSAVSLGSSWKDGSNNSESNHPRPTFSDRQDRPKTTSTTPGTPATIRGEDDPRTLQAIEEDRRLYVGNLPYVAKTKDVEELFISNGYQIEHINMSIDPYTGRNPSYGFVELASKAQADRAMRELSGEEILGRAVKLGPGVARSKKRQSSGHSKREDNLARPVFERWSRIDAPDHFQGYSDQGRRLWVGGLPRMADHNSVNEGIRELFAGFEIEAVSKVIIPKTPALGDPKAWDHRYLFVDFLSAEEARRAVKATDGRHAWGVKIRVRLAHPS